MKEPQNTRDLMFGVSEKPVFIGSVFYKSDRKVKDHKKGEVNLPALKRELNNVKVLKERVGLGHALDVIAETPLAMENYLSMLAEISGDPLFIGGLNEETRVAGYRKAKELGIEGRCGVNSIGPSTGEDELSALRDNGIRFAILQTLDPSAIYPQEKLTLLKGNILEKCAKADIGCAAVDVGIIDFTSTWLACESIKAIKSELGLSAGCAPSNAAYQPLVTKRITRKSARSMNVALCAIIQLAGADFVLYGPLKASSYLFEAAAVVEGVKAYGARLAGVKVEKSHPLHRFLPKLM